MKIIVYDHQLLFTKNNQGQVGIKVDHTPPILVLVGDTINLRHIVNISFWEFLRGFLFRAEVSIKPKELKKNQTSGKLKDISTITILNKRSDNDIDWDSAKKSHDDGF